MNGCGWVCDECGKTEVLAGDAWVTKGGEPPDGWYLVFKAPPGRAQANERWELCSIECIHAQTKKIGPMRYDPADPVLDCTLVTEALAAVYSGATRSERDALMDQLADRGFEIRRKP